MSSSTTSPASTRIGEPDNVATVASGPFSFQQLPDPVKLIDERIKVRVEQVHIGYVLAVAIIVSPLFCFSHSSS